jgi:hypothetical protein
VRFARKSERTGQRIFAGTLLALVVCVSVALVYDARVETRRFQHSILGYYFGQIPKALESPTHERILREEAETEPLAKIAVTNLEYRKKFDILRVQSFDALVDLRAWEVRLDAEEDVSIARWTRRSSEPAG